MKIKLAAIIGMVLILATSAVPAQAAGLPKYGSDTAQTVSHADLASEYRYMRNGWHYIDGTWYYVRGGKAVTGWVKYINKWYFLDKNGKMQTGWIKVDGKWYCMDKNGRMQTGWVKDGGKWYFLSSNGEMKTGWVKYNNKWYRTDDRGAMQTGWVKVKGLWYYLDKDGKMKTGWVQDGGKWYYLTTGGAMKTGWLKLGGKSYYLAGNGAMQTGWLTLDGKKYYFDANGVMDAGKTQEEGKVSDLQDDSTVKTKGEMVAAYALQFVGNPYVYGGNSLTTGTDCSGFVMLIYRHFGVSLPHYDAAIRTKGKSVASLAEAKAGDIICYYGHVAIYLGDGRIVHASNSRDGIKISERADYRTIAGIRRIFD